MQKKPPVDPAFREVASALTEPPRSRHSALYLWLRRNRVHVERHIAEHGINWPDFAATLGKAGVTNRNGEPFTGAAAKQTWFRLRQAIKDRPASEPPVPAPSRRQGEIAHGVASAPAKPTAAVDPTPSDQQDATAIIAKPRTQMDKRSGR